MYNHFKEKTHMAQNIPEGWTYTYEELDKYYHLSYFIKDKDQRENLYSYINLLQFYSKNYRYWLIEGDLSYSYYQNYLIILGAIVEGIITYAFRYKEYWCFRDCGKDEEKCKYYYYINKEDEYAEPVKRSDLPFYQMLDAAKDLGMLKKVSDSDLDNLRKLRNNVHISALKEKMSENESLSVKTINQFQMEIKMLADSVIEYFKANLNCKHKKKK